MSRRGGRPPILTEELIETIRMFVAAGNYIETAAACSGVHKDSIYEWLKRAKIARKAIANGEEKSLSPHDELCVQFSDAMRKAVADAEARDLAIIGTAATTQWQAAAWRLERRNRERWGRSVAYDPSAPQLGPDGEEESRSAGRVVPGFVLPMALPEDSYRAVVDAMRSAGTLPGLREDELTGEPD